MSRFIVEPLPARPNLELQQKLAKQLLRAAWAGESEAMDRIAAFLKGPIDADKLKLHDVQLVVARGYGFANWAAMKHKIESLTQTPLEQFDSAVRAGDAERARTLLKKHTDLRARINEPRFDFDSPAIHQAKKQLPLVDVLLEFGADINARSKFWAGGFGILEWDLNLEQARPLIERGATITVWAAAGLGLLEELQEILRVNPSAARERGGDGRTALHGAADLQIARLLLDSGAELEARDTDHGATPLQYHIGNEAMVRLLIRHGAEPDLFVAARLGDVELVRQCLRRDPAAPGARVGQAPFAAPGGHIYIWTLGAGTPLEAARMHGHVEAAQIIQEQASPRVRFLDALWNADRVSAQRELSTNPLLMQRLEPQDHALVAEAAWACLPESIRLMVELGLDPHVPTVHRSTSLDRASFHGFADVVALLLELDREPPLNVQNEFGAIPLGTCIYGSMHGWKVDHPQDHARTASLLLEAGSPVDPAWLPTGSDAVDAVLREWLKSRGAMA